jgi:hypothetical protein
MKMKQAIILMVLLNGTFLSAKTPFTETTCENHATTWSNELGVDYQATNLSVQEIQYRKIEMASCEVYPKSKPFYKIISDLYDALEHQRMSHFLARHQDINDQFRKEDKQGLR